MWNFERFKDKTALISDDGTRMTYSELHEAGDKLVRAAGERCLVFCLCSNTIGSVVGYTGFLENRIVPALFNVNIDKDLLKNLLNTYRPKYVWAPENKDYLAKGEIVYSAHGYHLLRNTDGRDYPLHNDLALLLTTSGSTGSSKFVRQTYRNIEVNTQQIVQYLELVETERAITTLPMNYTYGCSIINTHLYVGATILLTEKSVLVSDFWKFFQSGNATSLAGVPFTYEMLDKLHYLERLELPNLRTMTQAGGKISPELHKKLAEYAVTHGKKFIVMYGACEATARMGYLPYDKALEKQGSCGIAIPGGKFSLIDAEGKIIEEPWVAGELIYEGENVTMGYAEKPEDLAKGDERHGRLETGDIAQRDEDGFYYIVGRKKRFLKVYGNRVSLDEIERLLKAQYDKMDCAVGGIDDHVMIFVTDASAKDEMKKFIADKTKLNPKAFQIIVLDSIPKTDSGKTRYAELAKYYPSTDRDAAKK